MKKLLLRAYPYVACVVAGVVLLLVSNALSGKIQSLVLGIAGAFFAIPCLYVIYESARSFSSHQLNKELFEYVKMRIDREILSVVNQLMKLVQTYEQRDASFKGINAFLSQDGQQLSTAMKGKEYLGFQILKEWDVSENNLEQILESPFVLQKLENDQAIAVVTLMKQIRSLADVGKNVTDLYELTNEESPHYRVQAGVDMNQGNSNYPDRYLLLKRITADNYQVADFGDFPPYQVSRLLHFYRINEKYREAYANEIADVMAAVNHWVELTGREFLIDTRTFRLGTRPSRTDVKGHGASDPISET